MNPMPSETRDPSAPVDLPLVEPPSAGFIVQLFVIPAVIVVVVVIVWLLFGKLAGGERDAMSYVETMKSPSANWRAAFELSSLIRNDPKLARDPRLLGELAALLDQDLNLKTDEKLLQYLAYSLGTFQTLEAVSGNGQKVDVIAVLCRAFEDSRPAEVRIAAGVSLAEQAARLDGTLDDPRAVKALAAAKGSDSTEVRKIAAYALGFFGGPDATAALKAAIDDPDRDVRYNAALALGRRDDLAALGSFRELLSDKALEFLYKDTPVAERSAKIESLEHEALNSLEFAAGKDKHTLLDAVRPEVDLLTRSGLATVRSRAQEVLKTLPVAK
jgi:HEAT repeat protein